MEKYVIRNKKDLKKFLDDNFPKNFIHTSIVYDYGITIDYSMDSLEEIDYRLQEILYFLVTHYNITVEISNKECIYFMYELI